MIPIVSMGRGGDLVEFGLADSLARPGGNVTGLTNLTDRLHGKRLQLLTEAVPHAALVAVLWDGNLPVAFPRRAFEEPARALGVQLMILELQSPDELDAAFEAAAQKRADAAYVATAPLFNVDRARVVALAARHRLPTMYQTVEYVPLGGLLGYEAADNELQRRAAYFVDRILKGAKPADLPVEQPMTFDFVVNMNTAHELGITFPNEIMLQVTEVIP